MSDIVIRVENLSKRYTIRHLKAPRSGDGLRHAVQDAVRAPFRNLRASFAKRKAESQSRPNLNSRPASLNSSASEDFYALRDVSFEVKRGEVLGIIGRNGAGKSTLLKLLSRITEPTGGRIGIKGRVASLLEVGTGFHQELTGRENIFLNGAILGMSRAEVKRKFDDIVDFAGVDKFLDTPVKRYSSGMYVRLAFGVAAHLEPEILIVDEVLAVGDAEFQKKCLGKMGEVAHQGRTILFVSHQMGALASLCSRGLLLDAGRFVLIGDIQQTVREYLNLAGNARNYYSIDPNKLNCDKSQIISVQTETKNGIASGEFYFAESVCLTIKLSLVARSPGLLLGVALDSSLQTRVFTVLLETSKLQEKHADGNYVAKLELPSKLIAPNRYSFTIALFEHRGAVHDHLQTICPIQIVDDGTSLSRFEGIDYGNVIVNAHWNV